MKLYLSSYRLGEKPEVLTNLLSGFKQHVGIILNAGDLASSEVRSERLKRVTERFEQLGLSSEEIDLRSYFGEIKISKKDIEKFGLIWVQGGNVFVLRRAYKQSGFDMCLDAMLQSNIIVYGGESAGAVILGKTLEGLELVDDSRIVPEGYHHNCIRYGLGLIDYTIIPHYKSDNPESSNMDILEEFLRNKKLPYRTLRDGEVIIYS